MRVERSLRRRLVAAYVMLAVIIGSVFASASYIIVEAVEHELIDGRLSRAAEEFIAAKGSGAKAPPVLDLRFAAGDDIPPAFRDLKAGLHDLNLEGRELHVLIAERGGTRYAVIDDVSDFERLEFISFVALAVAFFCGVLLAVAIARASASRIIAPLTDLADRVQQDNVAGDPQLLNAPDEIGLLARAFEARSAEVGKLLARERFFTADVSHELRTPLTVILGAAELLTARLGDRPDLLAVAERIRRTSAETATHVSALLQLARPPAKSGHEALAMRPIVEREIERCRPLLDGKPVTLSFDAADDDVWVEAGPELAAVAVGNLLRNACLFTERGTVHVNLGPDALVVEDTGRGIPPAIRNRIFEPFVRGDDDPSGGSGLGLSIVKRVAEHLGWSVRLDNTPDGGSRFTLAFGTPQAT